MQRIKKDNAPWPSPMALALVWALACSAALAESSAPTAPRAAPAAAQPLTLPALFERAWARQPEAQSSALRREAAQAARNGATSWTAEPVALEMQAKTDRPGSNQGSREVEVGLALPLWLPGERARKAALGDAEIRAVESRRLAAQLKLAASVREAWWAFQRAHGDWGLAQDRLLSAQRLAADVARRFKAGDMSRADQHQADGAVAQAEAAVAEATGARDVAQSALTAWAGGTFNATPAAHTTNGPGALVDSTAAEPLAETMPGAALSADHPAVADWLDQADVARRAADLAAVQTRANPELTVAATRGREQSGERYQQTFTMGVRVPLGGGGRAHAKQAAARADALEAEVRANLERDLLLADFNAANARVKATAAQRDAVARHAELARQTQGFIDKAFRLGETDLPTRLRVELEAAQAERQLARARIDAAAAISTLRQALGLLPQ